MSGSGGYYRYHCKHWMTYDCPNWVWMNNTPCATCMANGRDSEESVPASWARVARTGPLTWEAKSFLFDNKNVQCLPAEEVATEEPQFFPVSTDSEFEPAQQLQQPSPI